MASLKRVRVIKKVQEAGAWRFVSLKQNGSRYLWDDRPGTYFLEWWEGAHRRREAAGQTPSEVIWAKRRKQDELRFPTSVERRPEPAILPKETQLEPDSNPLTATRTALTGARYLFIKSEEGE
jgi:hypothetical protein